MFMVLVKHMWIAYCNAVHGRGRYAAPEVWHKAIDRVRSRVEAYLLVSGRLLTRLETWVTRDEGPQAAAITGEQAKRGAALQPLGTIDWEKRPPELTPTVPWEQLKNFL